jgi:hypothetical protein
VNLEFTVLRGEFSVSQSRSLDQCRCDDNLEDEQFTAILFGLAKQSYKCLHEHV